jgi:hypothetical protein
VSPWVPIGALALFGVYLVTQKTQNGTPPPSQPAPPAPSPSVAPVVPDGSDAEPPFVPGFTASGWYGG